MSAEAALDFVNDMNACTAWQPLKEWLLTSEHTLGSIDCPVRIAWAEKDAMIPREPCGARFPELVPDAERGTLAGVGHVPMYDDPPLVVSTVLELTASVDGRERSH
jgi:pimeloyl-ACP methyl ester carboxylesterase